jgi:uncharacterized protein (TIGR03435 family)
MTISLRLAIACVRSWTRLYTTGLPPDLRAARRREIDADLWASLSDDTTASQLFVRLVLGVPDDVGWRLEHALTFGRVRRRSLTVSGQLLGAAVIVCAVAVIRVDATRKLPTNARPAAALAVRHGQNAWACAASTSAARRQDQDACANFVSGQSVSGNRVAANTVSRLAQPPTPTFEAASIKRNTSGEPNGTDTILPGGRYTSTNLSLLVLIRFAYDPSARSRALTPFEVEGGPSWMRTDRFDINATAGRDVSLTELRARLRTLLAERFHVQAHVETRQMPVYRMVLVQPGKLGPQLRRTEADCASAPLDPLRGIPPGEHAPCGYFGPSPNVAMGTGRAYQAFRGMTMEDVALRLHEFLGRRVIDSTNLAGYFDGDFEFTSEIMLPPPPPGQPNPYDGRIFPSISSVLPQQLGLKLDAQRGPADILVIDRADHPTPD